MSAEKENLRNAAAVFQTLGTARPGFSKPWKNSRLPFPMLGKNTGSGFQCLENLRAPAVAANIEHRTSNIEHRSEERKFSWRDAGFRSAASRRDAARVARRFSAGNRTTEVESPVGTKELLRCGWAQAGFAGLESPAHKASARLGLGWVRGVENPAHQEAAPLGSCWVRGAGSPAHEEDVRAAEFFVQARCRPGLRPGAPNRSATFVRHGSRTRTTTRTRTTQRTRTRTMWP